jgi:hypothetical protein
MTAIALPHEPGVSVRAGIVEPAGAAHATGRVPVPVEALPECTCIVGDCDRDHDNE